MTQLTQTSFKFKALFITLSIESQPTSRQHRIAYIERLFTTKVDQNIKEEIERKHKHPKAEHTNAQRKHAHT